MAESLGAVLSEATLVGEGVGKVGGEPERHSWSESSRSCMLNPGSHVQNSSPQGKQYWLPWNLNTSTIAFRVKQDGSTGGMMRWSFLGYVCECISLCGLVHA